MAEPTRPPEPSEAGAARWASYGWTVLVAIGWYVTVLAALVLGKAQVPGHGCANAPGLCFEPLAGLIMLLVLASPFLLGMLVCALVLAIPINDMTSSPPLAGTLSAVSGILLAAAIAALILGVR
jgi:hypothetical protein